MSACPTMGNSLHAEFDSSATDPRPLSRMQFEEIYREHCQGVFGVARHLCGSSLAAEVTQEVFLRFWQDPDRFDPERGTLRSLLLTMSHNISVDKIRSEKSRRARELRAQLSDITISDNESSMFVEERTDLLREALSRLADNEREAIITAFFGNCTYQEAAMVLNVPEGTLKSRIRRGMNLLREDMTKASEQALLDDTLTSTRDPRLRCRASSLAFESTSALN